MAFLNPWLLLGLAGVGVPIAVHLFNRFRPKTVEWAAMELLRRALATRSRQVKVEDLILLILRTAAVLLLALALARPTLMGAVAGLLGGSPRAGVVLAIDGSYSMDHRSGMTTRFDAARQRAREALGSVASGSPLTIALLGREVHTLLRNTGFDAQTVEPILKGAAPMSEPMSLDASFEALEALVREMPGGTGEVYLITDGQASTWQNLSPASLAKLQTLNGLGGVMIVPVEAQRHENVAITRFELASGAARQAATARYVATVHNSGASPQRDVKVRLIQDGQAVDQRTVDELVPGASAQVSLMARFEQAGVAHLTAELGADGLAADNTRHAVAQVRSSVRVLLVDGQPAGQPFAGQVDFLAAALVPRAGIGRRGIDVQTIDWLSLPSVTLTDYDVVMLANVTDVPAASAEALRAFVEAGGGLTVFLGDRVEPRLYNARFGGAQPLLPAELAEPVGDPESADTGWSIEVSAADHPVTRVLASLPRGLMDEVRVLRRFPLMPRAGGAVLLSAAGEESSPLMVGHRVGKGSVLLVGTTASRNWTNLPVHPAFPILAHQMVGFQTRQAWEMPMLVGDGLRVGLPSSSLGATVQFTPPEGDAMSIRAGEGGGQIIAELAAAPSPGFFRVETPGVGPMSIAVNVDPAESDVAVLSAADLRQLLDGTGVRVLSPGDDVALAVRERRIGRELWRPLVFLALLAFIAEAILAHRFTARAHQKVTLATATQREDLLTGVPQRAEAA